MQIICFTSDCYYTNRNIFIAFVHGEKGRGEGGKGGRGLIIGVGKGGAEAPNNGRGDSRRMELKGLLMATRMRNCIES